MNREVVAPLSGALSKDPPWLGPLRPPFKTVRDDDASKVLRILHSLHLTYMRHQAAVEKARGQCMEA